MSVWVATGRAIRSSLGAQYVGNLLTRKRELVYQAVQNGTITEEEGRLRLEQLNAQLSIQQQLHENAINDRDTQLSNLQKTQELADKGLATA